MYGPIPGLDFVAWFGEVLGVCVADMTRDGCVNTQYNNSSWIGFNARVQGQGQGQVLNTRGKKGWWMLDVWVN